MGGKHGPALKAGGQGMSDGTAPDHLYLAGGPIKQ
jgi:hypothetical protein